MGKPKARSIAYQLIEAGQLTRRLLLVPLVERGLEPGDDALLFAMPNRRAVGDNELSAALGLDAMSLEQRLKRFCVHDLVERHAVGATLSPGVMLTERGRRIRALLAEHWASLEMRLIGDLPKRDRKALRLGLSLAVSRLRSSPS